MKVRLLKKVFDAQKRETIGPGVEIDREEKYALKLIEHGFAEKIVKRKTKERKVNIKKK